MILFYKVSIGYVSPWQMYLSCTCSALKCSVFAKIIDRSDFVYKNMALLTCILIEDKISSTTKINQ